MRSLTFEIWIPHFAVHPRTFCCCRGDVQQVLLQQRWPPRRYWTSLGSGALAPAVEAAVTAEAVEVIEAAAEADQAALSMELDGCGGRDEYGVGAGGDAAGGNGDAAHVQILHIRRVLYKAPPISLLTLLALERRHDVCNTTT